ncbi:MAG: hypothetical protein ACI3W5_04955 [Faecousia sp.]
MTTKLLEEILYEEKLDMVPQRAAEEINLGTLDQLLKECPPTAVVYNSTICLSNDRLLTIPTPTVRVECSKLLFLPMDDILYLKGENIDLSFGPIKKISITEETFGARILYLHCEYRRDSPKYAADYVLLLCY